MAEFRIYEANGDKNDLKLADSEKSAGNLPQGNLSDAVGGGIKDLIDSRSAKNRARKRLPWFVDVLVGILTVAIAVGIVFGAYGLFRHFTDNYEVFDLEYKIIRVSNSEDLIKYRSLRNKELFLDTDDGNMLYFGTVLSSEVFELKDGTGSNMLVVIVKATTKYKEGEGYTIGGRRVAVGSHYTLRSDEMFLEGDVVEIADKTEKRLADEAQTDALGGK